MGVLALVDREEGGREAIEQSGAGGGEGVGLPVLVLEAQPRSLPG